MFVEEGMIGKMLAFSQKASDSEKHPKLEDVRSLNFIWVLKMHPIPQIRVRFFNVLTFLNMLAF